MNKYTKGFVDGLTAYAWWKDGTQFIGATGMKLSEALAHVELTWSFNQSNEKLTYRRGFADGITAFAWWKDGEQQVGTTGTKLNTVLSSMDKIWNFSPMEEDDV